MKDRTKGSVTGRADGTSDAGPVSDQGEASSSPDCAVIDLVSARAGRGGGSNEDEGGDLLFGLAYLASLRGEDFPDEDQTRA